MRPNNLRRTAQIEQQLAEDERKRREEVLTKRRRRLDDQVRKFRDLLAEQRRRREQQSGGETATNEPEPRADYEKFDDQKRAELVKKLNSKRIRRNDEMATSAPGCPPSTATRERPWALPPAKPVIKLSPNSSILHLCNEPYWMAGSRNSVSSGPARLEVNPLPLSTLAKSDEERPSTPYNLFLSAIGEAKQLSPVSAEAGQQTEVNAVTPAIAEEQAHLDLQNVSPPFSPRRRRLAPPSPILRFPTKTMAPAPRPSKLPRLKQAETGFETDQLEGTPKSPLPYSCEFELMRLL